MQTKGFANAVKGTNVVWMTRSIDDYLLKISLKEKLTSPQQQNRAELCLLDGLVS